MSTTLADVMSTSVHQTEVDATVCDASATMVTARVGSALVMNGTALIGIITERDVLRAAASGEDLRRSQVRDWMTPDPVTADPDLEVTEALEIMISQGFRHLPVTVDHQVQGIVSLRDLMSARIRRRA